MSEKKIKRSDKEWQKLLSESQYEVCRKKGTEPAFSGAFNGHREDGMYLCVCCGHPLFDSQSKFDSGSGWPSYTASDSPDAVEYREDPSHAMRRTEVVCAKCDSHLGHVFDDGPAPTGKRYCINSVALDFQSRPIRKKEAE